MTDSVINSMTRCRLYNLTKPLLMRMCNLKRACIKDKEPLQKAIVAQGYLGLKEETQGLICHSASPACAGWSINPIEYPTVKDYKSLYKERPDKSRLGALHLHRKDHEYELDAGDIDTI